MVNRSLFASHWYSIHFHPLPASHFHNLMCIVCLHFICLVFFCMGVEYPHWNPFCFCFHPLIAPLPPLYSHPHIDKQPVKVKRKKSFNLSRKFPFYKSKENIVQELVETEREYQLCDRWGWAVVFSPPFPFMLQFCLSTFIFSAHLQGWCVCVCAMAPLSSLSHCPREMPHMQSRRQAGDVGFSLVCLCICLWAPEECPAVCALPAVCLRLVCVHVLDCINTQAV